VRSHDDSMTRGLPVASPAHMLPVQVLHREVIAPDVVSLFIVLPGTTQAPAPYLPGQFVTLALPTPRETLYRSYSLCGDGDASQPWELTIKRIEMGAVSTHFYKLVREGTLLYSSLPRGTFTLPSDLQPESALMMIAMGSGITPIMGMLRALARWSPEERPLVQLHYASRSADDMIFGAELDAMDPDQTWLRQRHYLSSEGNRMTVDTIVTSAGRMARRAHWERGEKACSNYRSAGIRLHCPIALQLDRRAAQGGKEPIGIPQTHGQPPQADGQSKRTCAHRGLDLKRDDAVERAVHDPSPTQQRVNADGVPDVAPPPEPASPCDRVARDAGRKAPAHPHLQLVLPQLHPRAVRTESKPPCECAHQAVVVQRKVVCLICHGEPSLLDARLSPTAGSAQL